MKPYSAATLKIILIFLVLAPSIISTSIITGYWATRHFPWWTDGGNWLKHVNAVLGDTYPMWEEGTYQYPPIFFVLTGIVAALLSVNNDPFISACLGAYISGKAGELAAEKYGVGLMASDIPEYIWKVVDEALSFQAKEL